MNSMTMNWSDDAGIRLGLADGQIASTTAARGLAVDVLRGRVWITFEGEYRDYVLAAGERLPVNARGRMVIQGLAPSEVAFVRQPEAKAGLRKACNPALHPVDCWRDVVSGLSTARLNIDSPV